MRISLSIQVRIRIVCTKHIVSPTCLTDVKPNNILVNYGQGGIHFTGVQLADCGSTVPSDSAYAEDGDMIGAPIWRSPEAQLRIGWSTPTDIWSFGAVVCFAIEFYQVALTFLAYNSALWRRFRSL